MSLSRLQKALAAQIRAAEKAIDELAGKIAKEKARRQDTEALVKELAREMDRVHAAADLAARVAMRFGVAQAEPETFATRPELVPHVVFEAAVRNLLARDPLGAGALEKMGLEVAQAYGSIRMGDVDVYPHAYALAKAADAEVARKVQEKIAQGMIEGVSSYETAAQIAKEWDWPAAYAQTIVRTGVSSATSAGRFQEAAAVAETGIPVGFRFSCVNDADLRRGRAKDHGENHEALDGLVARVDDPLWREWTPPLGMNCRCILEPVVGDEVPKGFVRVPSGAAKAPGFGSRPDIRSYGAQF